MENGAAEPRSAAAEVSPAAWRRRLGWLGGLVLGAVLVSAAWAKAIDPQAFAELIQAERVNGPLPAPVAAFVALALEVAIGVALILGLRHRPLLVAATLLVVFFLALTGRDYWRDLQGLPPLAEGCGCWGNLVDRTPAQAFWQDLLLLVPALALAWLGGRPAAGASRWRRGLVVVLTLATLLLAWQAPKLPLDDWATRLRPGREVAALCAGRGGDRVCLANLLPDGGAARRLVVLGALADPAFLAAVPELNRYVLAGRGPELTVLAPFVNEELSAFTWAAAPAFTPEAAPAGLLRPLYRRLPRAFLVEGGRVAATWPGLPPLAELTAAATARGNDR